MADAVCVDGLRQSGLCDPPNLVAWDQDEVVERLKLAGCDRGRFMTSLFARRLAALGSCVRQSGIGVVTTVLSGRDRSVIETMLLAVNGIGPKVLQNFFMLRGL